MNEYTFYFVLLILVLTFASFGANIYYNSRFDLNWYLEGTETASFKVFFAFGGCLCLLLFAFVESSIKIDTQMKNYISQSDRNLYNFITLITFFTTFVYLIPLSLYVTVGKQIVFGLWPPTIDNFNLTPIRDEC